MAEGYQRDKLERLYRYIIDIEVCEYCGGHAKVIVSIEDPEVVEQILRNLKQKAAKTNST
jgi:hypothetical protein